MNQPDDHDNQANPLGHILAKTSFPRRPGACTLCGKTMTHKIAQKSYTCAPCKYSTPEHIWDTLLLHTEMAIIILKSEGIHFMSHKGTKTDIYTALHPEVYFALFVLAANELGPILGQQTTLAVKRFNESLSVDSSPLRLYVDPLSDIKKSQYTESIHLISSAATEAIKRHFETNNSDPTCLDSKCVLDWSKVTPDLATDG